MSSGLSQGTMLGKYVRFMKLVPYFGLPILMFFPAGMSLYWAVFAGMHLSITLIFNSKVFRSLTGTKDYLPNTILHRELLRKQELLSQGSFYSVKINKDTKSAPLVRVNQTSLGDIAEDLEKTLKPKTEELPKKPVEAPVEHAKPKEHIILDSNQAKDKDGKIVKLFASKPAKKKP